MTPTEQARHLVDAIARGHVEPYTDAPDPGTGVVALVSRLERERDEARAERDALAARVARVERAEDVKRYRAHSGWEWDKVTGTWRHALHGHVWLTMFDQWTTERAGCGHATALDAMLAAEAAGGEE